MVLLELFLEHIAQQVIPWGAVRNQLVFVQIQVTTLVYKGVAELRELRQFGTCQGQFSLIVAIELDASKCKLIAVLGWLAVFEDVVGLVGFTLTCKNEVGLD